MSDPLILTAAFDDETAAALQRLRDAHFPARLNIVPAHLTLFHHLPGDEEPAIVTAVRKLAAGAEAMPFTTPGLRFLGRGVAVEVACPGLTALRERLARGWRDWLGAQDRQGFRPHVTIQNKVAAAEARALFDRLAPGFGGLEGAIVGVNLWRYLGGPWERVAHLAWAGTPGAGR